MSDFNDWLTPGQQAVWRSYLMGASQLNAQLDERLRPFGLTLPEYEILVQLSESPQRRMRMSDLANRVQQSRSRLTHTIQRMENNGFVQRVNCAEDRRGVFAELTEAGMAAIVAAAPDHVAAVREFLVDAVPADDFEAFGQVWQGVMAAVSSATDDADIS